MSNPVLSLKGGPGVVAKLLRTKLGRELTAEQATELWARCKVHLAQLPETIQEAEESQSGSLDTLPRSDVMSALSQELAGRDWPINATPQAEVNLFIEAICQGMDARQYAYTEELP
jgi:hypothetical protein